MLIAKINKWWTTQMAVTVTLIKVDIALVMKTVDPSTDRFQLSAQYHIPVPSAPCPLNKQSLAS